MKRNGLTVTLLLALSLLAFSQANCGAPDTNRAAPDAAPTTTPGRETVDTAAIESELLRIENDWPRVLREKDVEAVKRVEADDAIFVYPDGTTGDAAQDIKDIESGALSADSWEMADLKVKVLDNDAAVVTGRSIVKGGKYKAPDGKTIDISGQYRFIDTFARRNGQWKVVAGISTAIRQPPAGPASSPAAKASPTPAKPPAASPRPTSSPRPTPSG